MTIALGAISLNRSVKQNFTSVIIVIDYDRIFVRLDISGVYDEKKPNDYLTYDYDTIYRTITSKVIEGFGAEHDRIHKGRVLIFNPKLLIKSAKQYDVSDATKGKLKEIVEWQKEGVSVKDPVNATNDSIR